MRLLVDVVQGAKSAVRAEQISQVASNGAGCRRGLRLFVSAPGSKRSCSPIFAEMRAGCFATNCPCSVSTQVAQMIRIRKAFGGELGWPLKEERGIMSRGKRSSKQKLRILLEGMSGTMDISDVCRREGIHPSQFYQWKRQLMSGASRVLESENMKPSARESRLQGVSGPPNG